jgi:hypothetical protein
VSYVSLKIKIKNKTIKRTLKTLKKYIFLKKIKGWLSHSHCRSVGGRTTHITFEGGLATPKKKNEGDRNHPQEPN